MWPVGTAHTANIICVNLHGLIFTHHPGWPSTIIYAGLFLGLSLVWGRAFLLCSRQEYTWGDIRRSLFAEGMLILSSTLLLAVLEAPDFYPPARVTFGSAVARGAPPVAIAAFFGPACRVRTQRMYTAFCIHVLGVPAVQMESLRLSMVQALEEGPDGHSLLFDVWEWGLGSALSDHFMEGATYAVGERVHKLAEHYDRHQFLLVLICIVWFAIGPSPWWRLFGTTDGRVILFGPALGCSMMMLAASFPSDLKSQDAIRALRWPVAITCLRVAINSYTAIAMDHDLIDDGQSLCWWVQTVAIGCVSSSWLVAGALCPMGHLSWPIIRRTLVFDGVLYTLATLLMQQLGPPRAYPPYGLSFPEALLRGASTPFVALLLTPTTRKWFAGDAVHEVPCDVTEPLRESIGSLPTRELGPQGTTSHDDRCKRTSYSLTRHDRVEPHEHRNVT
mmetsp:Transcript_13467/g.34516  ORF Transcript_13467/g.34516 Transcript_13467/m.34516 type:complete len:447 (+) Transcript_13467:401-1741(+)